MKSRETTPIPFDMLFKYLLSEVIITTLPVRGRLPLFETSSSVGPPDLPPDGRPHTSGGVPGYVDLALQIIQAGAGVASAVARFLL
jgi:hypothetical protein